MANGDLTEQVLFHIGPIGITGTVTTTWGVMLALTAAAWVTTRGLTAAPQRLQTAAEHCAATV